METEKKPRKPRAKKTIVEQVVAPVVAPVVEKKKMGRPKKVKPEESKPDDQPETNEVQQKKKGRPKKVKNEEPVTLIVEELSSEPQEQEPKKQEPKEKEPKEQEPKEKEPKEKEPITPVVAESKSTVSKSDDKKFDDDDDEEPTIDDYKTLLHHYINRYAELQRKMSKYASQVDALLEESLENIYRFFVDCRSLKRTAKRYCMDPPDIFELICMCDGNDLVASTAKDYKEVMLPVRPELFPNIVAAPQP